MELFLIFNFNLQFWHRTGRKTNLVIPVSMSIPELSLGLSLHNQYAASAAFRFALLQSNLVISSYR